MSSPYASQDPFSPRLAPHIRLNSNKDNILEGSPDSTNQPFTRSLLSRQNIPASLQLQQQPKSRSRNSLYNHNPNDASTEFLLPPKQRSRSRSRRYRDESPVSSGASSPVSPDSGRSSLDGDFDRTQTRLSPYGPAFSPFDDSRPSSRGGSDDGYVNTQTVSDKYNIMPSAGLLLFPEDVEKDDWLHNPNPADKESRDCNIFTRRGCVNVGGLVFITVGVLMLFVGYPILTFVHKQIYPHGTACLEDPNCISASVPLLTNVRQGPIDPDTPASAKMRKDVNGNTQHLVFSDEFNVDGRSFYAQDDPYFQAVDLWYGVTQDLEWYDPDAISTANGTMNIRFDAFKNHGLNYRSGMLQSWDQMCFKGGYMEASISLPGAGDTIGFWPGFWSMGNLGRPGYASTTDGLWPYTYWDKCDLGITKNQSSPDGLSFLPGMRLPACTCSTNPTEHPSWGKSRSAPEIDALEASVGYLDPPSGAAIGSVSQSAQMAPFDIWYQPNYDFLEVYDDSVTTMNAYRGGFFQQALSGVTNLNNDWYNGKAYQTYAYEYEPGATGYTTWYVGKDKTWSLDARALGPNGNIGQRVIPTEPMAVVANLGMSNSFANLNMTGLSNYMPATMRFDYIRIYQGDNDEFTCDPVGYPTTEYIATHPKSYLNKDKTQWAETGYEWPTNSFVDGCA